MKTIKELADSLGVSKTTIRKYLDAEFRANHAQTDRNGVITIDADGCKLIAETIGKQWKEAQTNENQFAETTANTENLTIPRIVWEALQEQLKQKDEQLAARDLQIRDLTEVINTQAKNVQSAQALHAGTMQQLGAGEPAHGEEVAIDAEPVDSPAEEPAAQPAPAEPGKLRKILMVIAGKL